LKEAFKGAGYDVEVKIDDDDAANMNFIVDLCEHYGMDETKRKEMCKIFVSKQYNSDSYLLKKIVIEGSINRYKLLQAKKNDVIRTMECNGKDANHIRKATEDVEKKMKIQYDNIIKIMNSIISKCLKKK